VSLGHSGSPIHGKSQRCRSVHVISCVQSQLIACKQADSSHQGTDDQCALMICVAAAAPPVSVHQCQLSAHPCHLPVPINATYQCCLSVPYEFCLSVPISDACQCPSV
ncbi:unnamed protein product, partial [Staurois parvus]